MDLVYINQTFGQGGAEEFNKRLLEYLSSQNRVTAYSNSPQFLINQSVKIHRIPFAVDFIGDWKGFLKGLFYLLPLQFYYFYIILINIHAHVYYFTGYIEKILITPWLKLFGKKVVWIEFGPLESVFVKFGHFPEILYRWAALFPDKIIFSCQNSRLRNQKYYPFAKPLFVIPLGSPAPIVGKPISSFDVLCLSRLEPGKGQDLLIKEWPKVIRSVPKATLYIAGEGDSQYTQYLTSLLSPNIKLLGRISDKYAYIKACKFTVFPSVWPLEGFGLVISESLSLGKPVVAFDHPPGNEIIKSGYNGLLSDSLSENIIYLLKHPKVLQKLSQNARLSWDKYYREDIYLQKYAHSLLW